MSDLIHPNEALDLVASARCALLDVRAEGEFAVASVPGFLNLPILHNDERHQVGLAYKTAGQAAAIAIGHQLTGPTRGERVAAWAAAAAERPETAIVTCWRGGLRSETACDWLQAAGQRTRRVIGGYKAMRRELLTVLAAPPPLLVLSGMTGSGKTALLADLPILDKVDLEDLAAHRGSSFGRFLDRAQPAQATFENALALALRQAVRPVLVEDEGPVIGGVHLPFPMTAKIRTASVVQLEATVDERCSHIFADYVLGPLQAGMQPDDLAAHLMSGVVRLKRRLGGAATERVAKELQSAFAAAACSADAHAGWITILLRDYYDPSYRYTDSQYQRPALFRGNYEECRQWLLTRYA